MHALRGYRVWLWQHSLCSGSILDAYQREGFQNLKKSAYVNQRILSAFPFVSVRIPKCDKIFRCQRSSWQHPRTRYEICKLKQIMGMNIRSSCVLSTHMCNHNVLSDNFIGRAHYEYMSFHLYVF